MGDTDLMRFKFAVDAKMILFDIFYAGYSFTKDILLVPDAGYHDTDDIQID